MHVKNFHVHGNGEKQRKEVRERWNLMIVRKYIIMFYTNGEVIL